MIPLGSWNYFYTNAISVPVEVSAAGLLITFWDPDVSVAVQKRSAVLIVQLNTLSLTFYRLATKEVISLRSVFAHVPSTSLVCDGLENQNSCSRSSSVSSSKVVFSILLPKRREDRFFAPDTNCSS